VIHVLVWGDRWDLAVAHAFLAEDRVLAGVSGYDLATFAAVTFRFGWSYRIDRSAGRLGYNAEVQSPGGVLQSQAVGWEPEVALAFALRTALTAKAKQRP